MPPKTKEIKKLSPDKKTKNSGETSHKCGDDKGFDKNLYGTFGQDFLAMGHLGQL